MPYRLPVCMEFGRQLHAFHVMARNRVFVHLVQVDPEVLIKAFRCQDVPQSVLEQA